MTTSARLFPFPENLLRNVMKLIGREPMMDRLYGSLTVDHRPAGDILGWRPPISLDEGLRRVAAWFRDSQ
jgi:nucleoside-diphosphate-sugar epimerase